MAKLHRDCDRLLTACMRPLYSVRGSQGKLWMAELAGRPELARPSAQVMAADILSWADWQAHPVQLHSVPANTGQHSSGKIKAADLCPASLTHGLGSKLPAVVVEEIPFPSVCLCVCALPRRAAKPAQANVTSAWTTGACCWMLWSTSAPSWVVKSAADAELAEASLRVEVADGSSGPLRESCSRLTGLLLIRSRAAGWAARALQQRHEVAGELRFTAKTAAACAQNSLLPCGVSRCQLWQLPCHSVSQDRTALPRLLPHPVVLPQQAVRHGQREHPPLSG